MCWIGGGANGCARLCSKKSAGTRPRSVTCARDSNGLVLRLWFEGRGVGFGHDGDVVFGNGGSIALGLFSLRALFRFFALLFKALHFFLAFLECDGHEIFSLRSR